MKWATQSTKQKLGAPSLPNAKLCPPHRPPALHPAARLQYQFTGGEYKDDYDAREPCDDAPSPVTPLPTTAPNPVPVATPAPTGPNAVYLGCFEDQKGARTMSRGYTDKENLTNEVRDSSRRFILHRACCLGTRRTNILAVSFSHRLAHDYRPRSIKMCPVTILRESIRGLPLYLSP